MRRGSNGEGTAPVETFTDTVTPEEFLAPSKDCKMSNASPKYVAV